MANETKGKFDNLSNKIKDHAAQSAANATENDSKSGKGLFGSLFKPTASSTANTQTTQTGTKPTVIGTPAVKPAANSTTAAKPTGTATAATAVKPAGTAAKPTGTASTAAVKPTSTASTATAAKPVAKSKFTDVPANAYYAEAVAWAVQKGITSGTTETTFSPDNPCHRGHAATFLWRSKGSPAPQNTKNPFKDVSEGPFYQAILWASSKGIIPGKSATEFAHTETCTRAQVLTYMLRAEGKTSATEADAIKWAAGKRLLAGLSGSASVPCTRADFVTFLYRSQNS